MVNNNLVVLALSQDKCRSCHSDLLVKMTPKSFKRFNLSLNSSAARRSRLSWANLEHQPQKNKLKIQSLCNRNPSESGSMQLWWLVTGVDHPKWDRHSSITWSIAIIKHWQVLSNFGKSTREKGAIMMRLQVLGLRYQQQIHLWLNSLIKHWLKVRVRSQLKCKYLYRSKLSQSNSKLRICPLSPSSRGMSCINSQVSLRWTDSSRNGKELPSIWCMLRNFSSLVLVSRLSSKDRTARTGKMSRFKPWWRRSRSLRRKLKTALRPMSKFNLKYRKFYLRQNVTIANRSNWNWRCSSLNPARNGLGLVADWIQMVWSLSIGTSNRVKPQISSKTSADLSIKTMSKTVLWIWTRTSRWSTILSIEWARSTDRTQYCHRYWTTLKTC